MRNNASKHHLSVLCPSIQTHPPMKLSNLQWNRTIIDTYVKKNYSYLTLKVKLCKGCSCSGIYRPRIRTFKLQVDIFETYRQVTINIWCYFLPQLLHQTFLDNAHPWLTITTRCDGPNTFEKVWHKRRLSKSGIAWGPLLCFCIQKKQCETNLRATDAALWRLRLHFLKIVTWCGYKQE